MDFGLELDSCLELSFGLGLRRDCGWEGIGAGLESGWLDCSWVGCVCIWDSVCGCGWGNTGEEIGGRLEMSGWMDGWMVRWMDWIGKMIVAGFDGWVYGVVFHKVGLGFGFGFGLDFTSMVGDSCFHLKRY